MDLAQLEASFRQQADDTALPQEWSSVDVARWATEAELEACVRARLIFDDRSYAMRVTVVAGTASYAINPVVDVITAAVFTDTAGAIRQLKSTDQDRMDEDDCRWRTRTGAPNRIIRDGQRIRLSPNPLLGGTLQLEGYRLPLYALEVPDDEPEIPAVHHDGLVNWLLYRAFGSKDSEQFDEARSEKAEARFVAQFGKRHSALTMRQQREKRRNIVKYGGIQ